ncbi:deoxyribonuclease-2-beta-like [Haemaphysalis longicornis]
MFDKETGVWVIHSVPSFPAGLFRKTYVYPSSGKTNAQVALCVTFNSTQLETIAQARDSSCNWALTTLSRRSCGAHQGCPVDVEPLTVARTRIGEPYEQMHDVHDVYSDLVAPGLESSLRVSTWSRTDDLLKPYCDGKYSVVNILSLSFNLGTGDPVVVKNTQDHSKWAISSDKDKHYVCVGTLNRVLLSSDELDDGYDPVEK